MSEFEKLELLSMFELELLFMSKFDELTNFEFEELDIFTFNFEDLDIAISWSCVRETETLSDGTSSLSVTNRSETLFIFCGVEICDFLLFSSAFLSSFH